MDDKVANFRVYSRVYYEVDEDTSVHFLDMSDYADSATAEVESWALLSE